MSLTNCLLQSLCEKGVNSHIKVTAQVLEAEEGAMKVFGL